MPKSMIRISGRSLDNKKAANSGGPLPVWIKRFTNPYAHPILNSSDHPSSFGRAAIRRFFDHPSHRFCAWGHDGDRIGQLPNCAAKWREASLSLAARQGQTWRRPPGICGDPCRRYHRVDLQLQSYSLLFNDTPSSSLLCTRCCVPTCVRSYSALMVFLFVFAVVIVASAVAAVIAAAPSALATFVLPWVSTGPATSVVAAAATKANFIAVNLQSYGHG